MMSFYWITRLDAINTCLGIMAGICGMSAACLIIFGMVEKGCAWSEEDKDYILGARFLRIGIICTIITLVFSVGLVFIPTTKEMCAIYVMDYLKDNEKVQKIPEQIIDATAAFLEEQAKKGVVEYDE